MTDGPAAVGERPLTPVPAIGEPSIKRLGRNTLIYSAGVFAQRLISVLMLPIYTRVMTPADYGVLDLLQMMVDIAALLLTAGLTAGLQRFYFNTQDESERRALVSTALVMEFGLACMGTLALVALAGPLATYGLGGAGSPELVRIAAVNFALTMLSTVPLLVMQTQELARLYLTVTLVKLGLQVSLNLAFVVGLRLGAKGILLSSTVTGLVIGTWAATWTIRRAGFSFSPYWLRQLRRFGVPYQLSWAASFLLTFGDRFFLQAYRGASVVGLYGLAYQFGFILQQVAGQPFLQAWRPQRFQRVAAPKPERDAATGEGFFLLSLILLTGATATCLFVEPFMRVMTTANFHGAATLVPLIVLAYVVEIWAQSVSFGIEVSEQTRFNAYATWASAIVAFGLYALLIPALGAYGAALGTVGGFLVRFALLLFWSQRLWHTDYGWRRPLQTAGLAVTSVLFYLWIRPTALIPQALFAGAVFAGFLGALWAVCLTPGERQLLTRAAKDLRHALPLLARSSSEVSGH